MGRPDAICLGRDDDGNLCLVYLHQKLPSEVIQRIACHLKTRGSDSTLTSLASCCRRIHDLVNPILYRTVILDAENAQILLPTYPRIFEVAQANGRYLGYYLRIVHDWILKSLLDMRISRWDTWDTMLRMMINDGTWGAWAFRIIGEQLKMTLEMVEKTDSESEETDQASSRLCLRDHRIIVECFENAFRIANWRHVEKLVIHNYPGKAMIQDFSTFITKVSSGLQHDIMPKLVHISIDETHYRVQPEDQEEWDRLSAAAMIEFGARTDYHFWQAKESASKLVFNEIRKTFGAAIYHSRSTTPLNVCLHGHRNMDSDVARAVESFLEGLKNVEMITCHGWQSGICNFPFQVYGDIGKVRYMLTELGMGYVCSSANK